jgi:hypothetical protein
VISPSRWLLPVGNGTVPQIHIDYAFTLVQWSLRTNLTDFRTYRAAFR